MNKQALSIWKQYWHAVVVFACSPQQTPCYLHLQCKDPFCFRYAVILLNAACQRETGENVVQGDGEDFLPSTVALQSW